MSYIDELNDRLKNVIVNTCNKIGCKNCGLKWDDINDTCAMTDLQNKIDDEKMNSTDL